MDLRERTYSVLVVSAGEKLNTGLPDILTESRFYPVKYVTNLSAAKRASNERAYDMILINSPLPDDPGIRFAIDSSQSAGSVVMLLVRPEIYGDIFDKVSEYGVFLLTKPVSRAMLSTAFSWMESARERLKTIEKKTVSFEEKMEEIRLVNKAKWLLISALKMDEQKAHRYIEKQAMDKCVSRKIIAEEIIKTYR